MTNRRSIDFFDSQFERQVREQDFALNPFEQLALPYLHGRVLDMGCGLGNLSIEAARRGCSVLALDASPTAIARINRTAAAEGLSILAEEVDFETYALSGTFDTVVAIGLFMFFGRSRALALLADAQAHTVKGGTAIVNVLIEGTTYLDMFEPGHYYLFPEEALRDRFKEWEILEARRERFPAPGDTTKEFATIVAKKIRDG